MEQLSVCFYMLQALLNEHLKDLKDCWLAVCRTPSAASLVRI